MLPRERWGAFTPLPVSSVVIPQPPGCTVLVTASSEWGLRYVSRLEWERYVSYGTQTGDFCCGKDNQINKK